MKLGLNILVFLVPLLSFAQRDIGLVSNKELNVVYRGYPNILAVMTKPGAKVRCLDCADFQKKKGNEYIAHPSGRRTMSIEISYGGRRDTTVFKVIDMPKPRVFIAGTDPFSSRISRGRLARGFIVAQLTGSPLDVSFAINRFYLTIRRNGVEQTFDCNGNKIPKNVASLILNSAPGTMVFIEPVATQNGKKVRAGGVGYRLM